MEDGQLRSVIESLIFASDTPLTVDRIKEVTGVNRKEVQRVLFDMAEEYDRAQRGFFLAEVAGGYQFRTRPEHAEWIKRLKKAKPPALSQPALETLAIIAYRQPLVRTDVERIRGVDSGGVLRTLLERKLIRILGKKDIPGKPLVYGTSQRFLEMFGLKDLSSLPTLKDLEGLGAPPPEGVLPLLETESEAKESSPAPKGEEAEIQEAGNDGVPPEGTENSGTGRDRLPEEG